MSRRQPLIWAALQGFRRVCCALPHERAVALGGAMGRAVQRLSGTKAEKARARCARILGVPDGEARAIVSSAYEHFGRALVEFVRLPQMREALPDLVDLRGEEHLRAALARGKGVILLSAHIGCWEYGAARIAQRGFPMNAIGAEQRDPRITAAIESLRRAGGVKPVGKGMDLRAAITCLKRNEVLAVLLDQDAKEHGIVSPFLGQPASTPLGPIRLAQKIGCAVVPALVARAADGIHITMTLEAALQGKDGAPFGDDAQFAADACNAVISRWIREYPGQWMWMYPRWASTLGDR